jgi:paraquat-inducible protein A
VEVGGAGAAVARVTACPECDLIQRQPSLSVRGQVHCARCGAFLYRRVPGGLERAVAYAATAAIVFVVANVSVMVALEAQSNYTSTTLFGTVLSLRGQALTSVATLVLTTALLMPALEIGATLYLLAVLRFWPRQPCFPVALRLLRAARRWSMVEVLVLGTLAALAKLAGVARVELGPGFWSFGALMALTAMTTNAFDTRQLAARLVWRTTSRPTSMGGA